MKKFVILFALVALACAAPVKDEEEEKDPITIISSESNHEDDGSYKYSYENSDGSVREEHANVADKDTDDEALEISGSYRYIDANGDEVVVNYTAGKNGFVPVGTIIPKEITENAENAKNLPNVYEQNLRDREERGEREEALKAPRE